MNYRFKFYCLLLGLNFCYVNSSDSEQNVSDSSEQNIEIVDYLGIVHKPFQDPSLSPSGTLFHDIAQINDDKILYENPLKERKKIVRSKKSLKVSKDWQKSYRRRQSNAAFIMEINEGNCLGYSEKKLARYRKLALSLALSKEKDKLRKKRKKE